jgi:uncharacterized membrane protein
VNLKRKLQRWLEAGVIDDATRVRIETFEAAEHKPIVLYALGVLGGGTIALGIVSLIAANWQGIPDGVKLAGDLLIAACLAAGTYVSARRGGGWTTEVLVTILYGFTLASFALVGQIYQLTAPAYRTLLLWSATTLPLVLLGSSAYLATLVSVALWLTYGSSLAELVERLKESGVLGEDALLNLTAVLVFTFPFVFLLAARLPWLVRQRPSYSAALTALAWLAVLAGGFGLQLVWYEDLDYGETLSWALLVCGAVVAAVTAALPKLYPDSSPSARRALGIVLGFGWASLALGSAYTRGSADFLGAILQVVWLALFAWAMLQLGRATVFNTLTGLIAVRILVVYFEVFGSLLSTGVGLISGGALTLLLAWVWRRSTRNVAERAAVGASSSDVT